MLVIPVGVFYSLWAMTSFFSSQETELIWVKDDLRYIKRQLNEIQIAGFDKKIAENQKRDDELIAKIAADVLDKVCELDKELEIPEFEYSSCDKSSAKLHVDCKTPSGKILCVPLSGYIHGVKNGDIVEGYTNARIGGPSPESSSHPDSKLEINVSADPTDKNSNMYVNIQTISGMKHNILLSSYIKKESSYKKLYPGYVILGIQEILPKAESGLADRNAGAYVDINVPSGEKRRIALSTYIRNTLLYNKIYPGYVIVNAGVLPPGESLPNPDYISLPENADKN